MPEADTGTLSLRRWTALCAGAEALGMTAAALAAKIAQVLTSDAPHGRGAALALTVIVAGGLVEGASLGVLQAHGLRRLLPRLDTRRWIVITTAVAGLGWAAASVPGVLATDDDGVEPPLAVVLAGAVALGAVMGALLGAAQATLLRRRRRWVLGNIAAWPAAMAVIFLGATTPGSTWSVLVVTASGTVTGAVAGTLLGLITGQFLPTRAG